MVIESGVIEHWSPSSRLLVNQKKTAVIAFLQMEQRLVLWLISPARIPLLFSKVESSLDLRELHSRTEELPLIIQDGHQIVFCTCL